MTTGKGRGVAIRLLGDVGLDTPDGFVAVANPMPRAVFALLALANGPVAIDTLQGQLWDDHPPATARKSLQNFVGRIRRTIAADLVTTVPGGYAVVVPDDGVDAVNVERLVGAARVARRGGRLDDAQRLLDEAMAWWRSEPLAGCAPCRATRSHVARLANLHAEALEERAAVLLQLGQPGPVVADMLELVATSPLRESAWALLVRARAAAGDRAGALETFRRARGVLVEELGLEPGPRLRAAERDALRPQRSVAKGAMPVVGPPSRLPRIRSTFVGRQLEQAHVVKLVQDEQLVTLTGVGGVGKTRLAVESARGAMARFDDGAAFCDLVAATSADDVWEGLKAALGTETVAAGESARAAALRTAAGIRSLLVLDNCEHVAHDVAGIVDELLDAAPGLHVLATSRRPLGVVGERVLPIGPLDGGDALELLQQRVTRGGAPPVDDTTGRRLCAELDRLPLAIELAAPRCRQLGAEEVVARLHDRAGPSGTVGDADLDGGRQATLAAAIAWSVDLLTPGERALLADVSVLPLSFGPGAVEALTDVPGAVATLGSLVDQSLVVRAGAGRFRLLDTIRREATRLLDDADDAEALRQRFVDWAVELVDDLAEPYGSMLTTRSAEVLDRERDGLVLAARWAGDAGRWTAAIEVAGRLVIAGMEDPSTLAPDRAGWVLREALDAGVTGEDRDRALAAHVLVDMSMRLPPRPDLDEEAEKRLWDRGRMAVMPLGLAGHRLAAMGRVLDDTDRRARGERMLRRAIALGEGHPELANVLAARAHVCLLDDDLAGALEHAERAEAVLRAHPGVVRGLPSLVIWLGSRWCNGRALPYDEVMHRSRGVWARDRLPHVDLLLAAFADPSTRPPRAPVEVDERRLRRQDPRVLATILAAVAQLAADEGDVDVAARLYAAARTAGPLWSTPVIIAQHRQTAPRIAAAMSADDLATIERTATDGGLDLGVDVARRWLAAA